MLKRLGDLFALASLVLICTCGGKVVVDSDLESRNDIPVGVCLDYCELSRTSVEQYCRNYDLCMDRCAQDFTEAKEEGCLEEMLAWYDCYTAVLKKSGFCDSTCPEETKAYHSCRDAPEADHE
jgi:hypothetical protein